MRALVKKWVEVLGFVAATVVALGVLIGLFVVLPIQTTFSFVTTLRSATEISSHGVATEAETIKLEKIVPSSRKETDKYWVEYSFQIGGNTQSYVVRQKISLDHYKVWTIGRSVSIRYLPDDPNVARLADTDADSTELDDTRTGALIVFGVVFLIIGGLSLDYWRLRRKKAKP